MKSFIETRNLLWIEVSSYRWWLWIESFSAASVRDAVGKAERQRYRPRAASAGAARRTDGRAHFASSDQPPLRFRGASSSPDPPPPPPGEPLEPTAASYNLRIQIFDIWRRTRLCAHLTCARSAAFSELVCSLQRSVVVLRHFLLPLRLWCGRVTVTRARQIQIWVQRVGELYPIYNRLFVLSSVRAADNERSS